MTYTIGAGKSFNMVLSHPDTTDPTVWDQSDALSDMKREFQGWDKRYAEKIPTIWSLVLTHNLVRLEKIIGMIESTIKWPLVSGTPLTRWASGRIIILGDAAHAMLPYMSQGKSLSP
jgi:salicylate hydroxylase